VRSGAAAAAVAAADDPATNRILTSETTLAAVEPLHGSGG
jgi:hypothetical protein